MGNNETALTNLVKTDSNDNQPSSTLQRIFKALELQRELMAILDERLNVVSRREDMDKAQPPTSTFHIEDVEYSINKTNIDLERLIKELVI